MRYQFFGKPVKVAGKTLWEIVGNLKNFGAGRLFLNLNIMDKELPTYYKIIKAVPFEKPENEFEFRKVAVVANFVHYGVQSPDPVTIDTESNQPVFILIPKIEESFYLDRTKPYERGNLRTIPKYITWPPLYKLLWETKQKKLKKNFEPLPNLKTITRRSIPTAAVPSEEDSWDPPLNTKLYRSEVPVDEMYKELVHLQKIYNSKYAQNETSNEQ